ncbi:T9SS C-terminal target domain-containing protein [Dysgonomonas sp. 216]|uniref:T9SS type A sorting domain-containing protein n=1 Tax=Dysgonomonas sp. 216 TaxID=2302934 RepID=UPI0013D13513|nr:T9SS type A sorting domain-containing protein [Dysgonomonas sp. 216]NDW18833.1 T9SS C-terminal target domain-containing protein [Dysgonomonas sp. 216]
MKKLLLILIILLGVESVMALDFYEEDKEALRVFLRQSSINEGRSNFEELGLAVSDTIDWQTTENWVYTLCDNGYLSWIYDPVSRLERLSYLYLQFDKARQLGGVLDCSHFGLLSKLKLKGTGIDKVLISSNVNLDELYITDTWISELDASTNVNIENLSCFSNSKQESLILPQGDGNKLSTINCNNNKLKAIDLSKNVNLVTAYIGDNKLKTIDLSANPNLKTVGLALNYLENIVLPSPVPAYQYFSCSKNCLKFSTMPQVNFSYISWYTPQKDIELTVNVGENIDISSEYTVKGSPSVYKWYDSNGTAISLTTVANGVFVCNDNSYLRTNLTCEVTNPVCPSLTLIYKVRIQDSNSLDNYNSSELEALRQFMRSRSAIDGKANFEYMNLTQADTLGWYTSKLWIDALANNIEWGLDDNGEFYRINSIDFTGVAPNTIVWGMDCSSFTYLKSLKIANSNVKTLDLSNNMQLKELSVTGTNISSLNLSNNNLLESLYCNGNELEDLILPQGADSKLVHIDCYSNKLKDIDFSANFRCRRFNASDNNLESVIIPASLNSFEVFKCANNFLKFSTLPLITYRETSSYNPQKQIVIDGIIKDTIDLASEYEINGILSEYKWYNANDEEIQLDQVEDEGGMFVCNDEDYIDEFIYCKVSNQLFPDLIITYKMKVLEDPNTIVGISDNFNSYVNYNQHQSLITILSPLVEVLHIYDMYGRLVISRKVSVGEELSVKDLTQGSYILTTGGKTLTFKFMKD